MTNLVNVVVSILILGVVVERMTELLHSAKIFLSLRNWIALRAYPPGASPLGPMAMRDTSPLGPVIVSNDLQLARRLAVFVNGAISCGYCTSVWVAMLFALACPLPSLIAVSFDWVIKVLLLHGVSNLYHVWYERCKKWATHPVPFHLMVDTMMIEAEEKDVDG